MFLTFGSFENSGVVVINFSETWGWVVKIMHREKVD